MSFANLFGGRKGNVEEQRASQYYPAFFESLPSLEDKTVVITGCSRGLGYTTALAVAKKGGNVIMLNRPSETSKKALKNLQEESEELRSCHHLVDCDLLDFDSVRKACQTIQKLTEENGVNVLCNNAGIMLQPDESSKDGYDITASTNVLSHFLITKELLPSLEKAASQCNTPSRVINMSSASGYGGSSFDARFFQKRGGDLGGDRLSYERYHQTKLANMIFTCALHDKLKNKPVLALACTPGVCGTDMFTHATTVMNGQPAPKSMVPSVEDGAMAQLKCIFDATVESGQLWGPGRNGALECTAMEPPMILVDEASKKMLWEVCEEAVGEFAIGIH